IRPAPSCCGRATDHGVRLVSKERRRDSAAASSRSLRPGELRCGVRSDLLWMIACKARLAHPLPRLRPPRLCCIVPADRFAALRRTLRGGVHLLLDDMPCDWTESHGYVPDVCRGWMDRLQADRLWMVNAAHGRRLRAMEVSVTLV